MPVDIKDRKLAQQYDAADELAHFRARFVIDEPDLIYLDGNSLGRLPYKTRELLTHQVDEAWGKRLIRGWNDGWFGAELNIGGKIAQLVGAKPHEVVMAESTSVNLFKLAVAALQAHPNRNKIVTDDLNFPSDLYILSNLGRLLNRPISVVRVPSADSIHGPVEALADAIDDQTALVSLSHTVFKSGYTYNMAAMTKIAHDNGALALWDLSHAVGATTIDLNGSQADLAVGCTYKYLNGGPGSPAFLYVREGLQGQLDNPITGWFSHSEMFNFELDFAPTDNMRRFMTGTPPMLSLLAVEPGVDLTLEAGMAALREKSVRQTEYLIALWEAVLEPLGFRLNSPRQAAQRGSHVSLGHDLGLPIDLALINEMNVLPDFREPDNIRLGIAPLYNTFEEIYSAVFRLKQVMDEKRYEKYMDIAVDVT